MQDPDRRRRTARALPPPDHACGGSVSRGVVSACTTSTPRRRCSQDCARSLGAEIIATTIGDFAATRVAGAFSLVYPVFNTIMNLTTMDEQTACFQNVSAHLERAYDRTCIARRWLASGSHRGTRNRRRAHGRAVRGRETRGRGRRVRRRVAQVVGDGAVDRATRERHSGAPRRPAGTCGGQRGGQRLDPVSP